MSPPTAVKSIDHASATALEAMRTPPHSYDAEQAVLGGIMLDPTALSRVADVIQADDFYRQDHKLIYRAILEQDSRDAGIDVVTLAEYLESRHQLDQAGGLSYLATLSRDTPTAANCRTYAEIVRNHAIRRQLIIAGGKIAEQGFNRGADLKELLDESQRLIMGLGEQKRDIGPTLVGDSLALWHEDMARREEATDGILGLRTGLNRLDEFTCGMEDGDLWIVAGRPGMGKTNFALTIAEYLSIRGTPVGRKTGLMFSLEMNTNQLISRLVSNVGPVDLNAIRRARMEKDQWTRTSSASTMLSKSNLIIDDTAGLSTMDMRARARRTKQKHGLDYIIVDHLQLVQARAENRTQEITNITRDLKNLAKSMKVPVIALSQLNRSVEQRQNKRPVMSDLRESGSIEQDADVIVFLYREAKYNPGCIAPSIAECIVGKQRNGPIDTVMLSYHGQFSRFQNADPEELELYTGHSVPHGTSRRDVGFEPEPDRRFKDG